MSQALSFAPAVAGLIEIETDFVFRQVDDVDAAGAVDVGQADTLGIEAIGIIEYGGAGHRHLGTESAIAQIGPVADFSIADTHEVGQAVAPHVREEYRLCGACEYQLGTIFLVPGLWRVFCRAEASLGP